MTKMNKIKVNEEGKFWFDENGRFPQKGEKEYVTNYREWWFGGLIYRLHRTDGPAVEWSNGDKEWWQHGLRHRVDGPAIMYNIYDQNTNLFFSQYWHLGKLYPEIKNNEDWFRLLKLMILI